MISKDDAQKAADKAAEKNIKKAGGEKTKEGKWDMTKAVDRLKGGK